MKKNRFALLAAWSLLLVFAARADMTTVDWGSQYAFSGLGNPDILDRDGFAIPVDSTWAVQIVRTNGTWTNSYHFVLQGTPLWTNNPTEFWGNAGVPGVGLQQIAQPDAALLNGETIFTRFFNNADPALATWVADVAVTNLSWTPSPTTPQSVTYDLGQVGTSVWYQAIPEPGTATALLFAAGLLALRRTLNRG